MRKEEGGGGRGRGRTGLAAEITKRLLLCQAEFSFQHLYRVAHNRLKLQLQEALTPSSYLHRHLHIWCIHSLTLPLPIFKRLSTDN